MSQVGGGAREGLQTGRVFVTGAGGHIGRRLCRRLVAHGVDVHAAVRRSQPDASIRCWELDLADFDATNRVLAKVRPDAVVHLAGHVAGAPDLALVRPTLASNVVGTVSLLVAASEHAVSRIVMTGSVVEPNDPAVAGSPYALSKWVGTAYARMFETLFDLPLLCLRLFMVYGPGQQDNKLIPYVIRSLLLDKSPRVSSGAWEIDWVYIDDVVDAYLAAIDSTPARGKTLDIGSGELVAMRSVIERLADLIGSSAQPEFGAIRDRPFELPRRADLTATEQALAWRPRVSLDQGLKATVDWYRKQLGNLR